MIDDVTLQFNSSETALSLSFELLFYSLPQDELSDLDEFVLGATTVTQLDPLPYQNNATIAIAEVLATESTDVFKDKLASTGLLPNIDSACCNVAFKELKKFTCDGRCIYCNTHCNIVVQI